MKRILIGIAALLYAASCVAQPVLPDARFPTSWNNGGRLAFLASIPCDSAQRYGMSPSASATANLAAFNSWFSGLSGASACLQFPSGRFEFSNSLSMTLGSGQSLSLRGSGMDSTELWFSGTSNAGIVVTYTYTSPYNYANGSSVNLSDATITTNSVGVANGFVISGGLTAGVSVGNRQSMVNKVAFRGHIPTAYWANDMLFADVSNVVVDHSNGFGCDGCNATGGTFVAFVGTVSSATPVQFTVANSYAAYKTVGVSATGYFQGLMVDKVNFTGVDVGVSCMPTVAEPQCNVFNSQINSRTRGVDFAHVLQSSIVGNLFYQGTFAGGSPLNAGIVNLNASERIAVSANHFQGGTTGGSPRPHCVLTLGGTDNVTVTGNVFAGCNINAWLVTGTSKQSVVGNTHIDGSPILDQGTDDTFTDIAYGEKGPRSTVAGLPGCGTLGVATKYFATNGRKLGEGAGTGTGIPVWCDGTNWRTYYDNSVAAQ